MLPPRARRLYQRARTSMRLGDHASAMSLYGVTMMALYDRERTGQGACVSTSLVANGVWSNGMQLQGVIAGFDLAAILEEQGYRKNLID